MADPRRARPGDDDRGAPRWLKVAAIVVAVVALLVVAMMLTGGLGAHDPGRHGREMTQWGT